MNPAQKPALIHAVLHHLRSECTSKPILDLDVIPLNTLQSKSLEEVIKSRFYVGTGTGGAVVSGNALLTIYRDLATTNANQLMTCRTMKYEPLVVTAEELDNPKILVDCIDLLNAPVEWTIPVFDASKPNPLPLDIRHFHLDWSSLSDLQVRDVMSRIYKRWVSEDAHAPDNAKTTLRIEMNSSPPDRYLQRYRPHFVRDTSDSYVNRHRDFSVYSRLRSFRIEHDDEYVENASGKQISRLEYMRHMAGHEDIILFDDIRTILRIGPTPMADSVRWSQDISSNFAQFIQVVKTILSSEWLSSKLSLTTVEDRGKSTAPLSLSIPSFEKTAAVLPLFRQLCSGDALFGQVCNLYKGFCSNGTKELWVDFHQNHFNKFMKNTPTLPSLPIKQSELLELLFYGTKTFHSKSNKDAEPKLLSLLNQHGQSAVMMAANSSLRQLLAFSAQVMPVVEQDYNTWLEAGAAQPVLVKISDLFASYDAVIK